MLCCGRKKDPRHVIAQRIAGSTSAFLPNQPTLYPQQQYVLANQSPYGTIGVQQQINLQQQQLNQLQQQQLNQLQQNVALQQAHQNAAAVQLQQQQTAGLSNVLSTNANQQSSSINQPSAIQQTKSVHFLNANVPNAQPIYSNTLNSPANSGIYGQIRANPLANAPNIIGNPLLNKPAGISNDVFRQIEAVEKQFDQMNINLDAIEKRGEMLIRVLDPRTLGRAGAEAGAKYLQQSAAKGLQQSVQFIEIIKRPGQTLGLYIRNKDNLTNSDGVFISKIEIDSPLFNSGLLHVGDEILAVNLVDVAGMNVDDVCVIMSLPRRLVLTIRSNNLNRLASNQLNQQIRQAMNSGNYMQVAQLQQIQQQGLQPTLNQPPIVVLKKELGKEDELASYEDDGSNENLLGNQLAQLVGDNVVVRNDEVVVNGNMVVYEDAYGRIGLRPRDETNWANRNQFIVGNKSPFAVTQQPGNLRTGRLSALGGGDPIYGTIDHAATALLNRPSSRLMAANKLQTRASIHRPPSSLRRPGSRLLHAESDNRLTGGSLNPTVSDYFLEQITRPSSRLSNLGLTADYSNLLNRRRLAAASLNQSLSTQGLSTMLRRRSTMPASSLFNRPPLPGPRSRSRLMMSDTTGSDSEFALHLPARPASALGTGGYHSSGYRSAYFNQPPSARYMLESGRASAMSFSNLLPRPKQTSLDFRFPLHSNNLIGSLGPNKLRRPGSQVRFDKQNTYYSTYDEDSDALEEMKRKHLLGRRNEATNISDLEYRQWLNRAPSTSAIYESVRKRSTLPIPTMPPATLSSSAQLQANSINKIAHSAENLIETIKNEQQKSLMDNNNYFNKNAPDLPPRPGIATLINDQTSRSNKKRDLPMTNKLALNNTNKLLNKTNISSTLNSHYQTDTLNLQRTIPNPTPVKPSENERMNLLTLNPREFFKYKYEKSMIDNSHENVDQLNELDNKTFNGLLYIHLLAGRGLRVQTDDVLNSSLTTSLSSTYRDLYCVIECDRQHKARTVVRSGQSSFDWDEKFELDIFEVKEVAFLLYSWDTQFKHKLCYKGLINLSNLNLEQNSAHSLALKMEGKGTLYLKIVYSELRICYARKHFPNKLFGNDLEMIVARENQGLSVPLIVKKCVEEVENRGLDLIGIYRICGSQVRKNLLKEAFENNSYFVELGVDHVPDINVITSLLKDYLRELPDPLFTKALFEMMVDGLSVCLPDDPTGNAKLMFSILECLPKINRCTVLFLMDHLKSIVNNCERNKMSANSIATIFGPLFCTNINCLNLRKSIEVFKFLLDIWPTKKEPSVLDSIKITNQSDNDFNASNQTSNKNLINERRRILASELSVEREKERLRLKDDNELMNKSLIESNSIKKSSNHQFNTNTTSNSSLQQTSQSSTNLNSLSGYNKPFSYHLPNRDFNYGNMIGTNVSSSNLKNSNLMTDNLLNNNLMDKSNAFDSSSSLRNNQMTSQSANTNNQLNSSNNQNMNSSNYYNSTQMDSGHGTGSGSTGSSSGGRNTAGSNNTTTSRYSSSSTLTPKKTVGWASNSQQESPTNRTNSLIDNSSLIGNNTSLIGSNNPLIGNDSSLIGNTSNSLMTNNTSLIGNNSSFLNNSTSDKYSNDYLNSYKDSYNSTSSRFNYSSNIGSNLLEDKRTNSSNILIGKNSLIKETNKYGSDLNETANKNYDSFR